MTIPDARGVPRITRKDKRPPRVIGDPRNDENVMSASWQASMLRLHNRWSRCLGPTTSTGGAAHSPLALPMVVLHDFLPTILGWRLGTNMGQVKPETEH